LHARDQLRKLNIRKNIKKNKTQNNYKRNLDIVFVCSYIFKKHALVIILVLKFKFSLIKVLNEEPNGKTKETLVA